MHNEGNYKQGEKPALRTGENNSKWNNWQRINLQNTTHISPKKTYGWPINTRKDAQHCSLLEKCKSKPHWGITIYQSEWPSSKSLQTINAREGVQKRECPYTVGGNVNWYSHSGKRYGVKKLGIKPPYDPAIPLLGIYPEETKTEKDTCISLFIAALFTIGRTWKQPRCPSTWID